MDETSADAIEPSEGKLNVEDETVLPKVVFDLKYEQYLFTHTYILMQNGPVHIRKGPDLNEAVLKDGLRNEKYNYLETIINDKTWYHINWDENGEKCFGFVNAEVVEKRDFQFDKMYEAVVSAEKKGKNNTVTYINNYHNNKGYAPLYHGQSVDQYGDSRSQSAPGYPSPLNLTEFSYLGDGTLVNVIATGADFTKVSLISNSKIYYVPNKYIVSPPAITAIKKIIVIDRENQNEAVFEKEGQEWKIISYTLATTGTTGKYHQLTPLGCYCVMEKRERFYYYKDGTTTIQGYAPYALRFAGGAYIHGVPVNYKHTAEGTRIDPGKIEYSRTIGTVPLSHKCIRNYTSHAKFLYDWFTPAETIVIVME